ncbi:MAG: DUF938 domain-containing protein [Alphaproteobacteria bacterium]|nr:DUF938 domain-containing protein [Alphaproteobacteria bacterium]
MTRLSSPAAQRNRDPILNALTALLPPEGLALEIASGTGEHAVHFAEALPGWTWMPTDVTPESVASVNAWREGGPANLRPARLLDVTTEDWGVEPLDLIYNANMVHISPWASAQGLMAGAGRHLKPGGRLVMYGPYRIAGAHTAPSNDHFDASLKRRDPSWGVRDLEALVALAEAEGLRFEQRIAMPANNFVLEFVRA